MQRLILYLQCRRQRLISVTLLMALLLFSRFNVTGRCSSTCSCRRVPRNTGWFDNVWQTYSHG